MAKPLEKYAFWLGVMADTEEVGGVEDMTVVQSLSAAYAGRRQHILVVEDNVALRFTLSEWLREKRYTVYEAANADEAITILDSPILIDLVITDIEMPGSMNGLGLVEHIRAQTPGMEVVMVSGNTSPMPQLQRDGCVFFNKPYNLETLTAYVASRLPEMQEE